MSKELMKKNKELAFDQKTQDLAEKNLYLAFREIEKSNLLYFRVLQRFNFIIEPNFSHAGAIGFYPEKKKIYMILRSKDLAEGSVLDVAGLIEHECGHVLYEHVFFPNEKKLNNQTLNVAEDLIINDSCHYIVSRMNEITGPNSKSILKNACFYSQFQKKYPKLQKFSSTELTSLQIYHIIKEQDQENNKGNQNPNSEKGDSQTGEGFDSHDQFEISLDSNGKEVISKSKNPKQSEEMQSVVKDTVSSAIDQLKKDNELDKAIGQLRGSMQKLVQGLIKTKTDKNAVLSFVNRITLSHKKTWSKLHKRYPYLAKAKKKKKTPKLLEVVDTSGSMGTETFFKMIKHQTSLLLNRTEALHIVFGDTTLQDKVIIKRKNQFNPEKLSFSGGGGTDLQFGWDYALENGLDGVIVHTDGYIGNFNDHGLKTIFFLYGDNPQEIEGYQNIRVYAED